MSPEAVLLLHRMKNRRVIFFRPDEMPAANELHGLGLIAMHDNAGLIDETGEAKLVELAPVVKLLIE